MTVVDKSEVATTASIVVKPLTKAEAQQLAECEQIIIDGRDAFLRVADALQDIRDRGLYRTQYKSFEEYCRDKWKFTARQANRLMGAGKVVENLKSDQLVSSVPVAVPENEAQARPLTELPPAKQIEAARKVAAKTDKPTAKDFKEAAEEVDDERPRVTVAASSSKPTTGKASMESLVILIDEVQTMVRVGKPKDAVLAKLKTAADLATRINNGGKV